MYAGELHGISNTISDTTISDMLSNVTNSEESLVKSETKQSTIFSYFTHGS